MKLSIIIAVFDSQEAVRRQILHFDRMNLPNDIEFIIVDDGSKPAFDINDYNLNNLTILATNDFRPWTQGIARNAGVDIATGDYLLMTDIDHILSKEAIIDAYNFTGYKMIFPRYFGVLLEDGTLSQDTEVLIDYGLDPERIKSKRGLYASVHGNTFAMRKELFERLGKFDPKHCLYGHHAGRRQGEDGAFNRIWNHYAADNKLEPFVLGSPIYIFPTGRYNIRRENNPKDLFHNLNYE